MKEIILESTVHKEKEIVLLKFERDFELIEILKNGVKDLYWSKTLQSWYTYNRKDLRTTLFQLMRGKAWVDCKQLTQFKNSSSNTHLFVFSKEQIQALHKYKQFLNSRRYSENTIKVYIESLKSFLRFFQDKKLEEIDNDCLVIYNNEYILKNKYSSSFQNQVVNSVKLFFNVLGYGKIDPELIHRPKREKELPNVLSRQEVKLILNALDNIKHKAMLSLIYSCGLRSGELINLKIEHVDSNRNVLIIKRAKGKKDRISPLSDKTIALLRDYYRLYKPKTYLFEGQNRGEAYDSRSLQQVLKKAVRLSKITKPVTLHWLRHSYATHLLESGTDLRYIQEILGHSSSKTTEIYTHVSTKHIQKIKSPFDDL